MAHPVLMPRTGQMTEECTLLSWRKEEGDRVEKGDILFEIETDKAVMEVEAFEVGILLRRLVQEGATVPVNTVCAYIGDPGEAIPDSGPTLADAAPTESPEPGLPTAAARAEREAAGGADGDGARLRISPRASRLAAEAGLDPRTLAGSGPGGRIVERDVQAVIASDAHRQDAAPVTALDGEDQPRPLSAMRRTIARRMTESASTIPQFTVTVMVDATPLIAMRAELQSAGRAVSINDLVMAAVAQSLVEMPAVNSRTDGASVWLRRRIHLGLAVTVPDGLVVPVIRDADHLTLDELHARAAELAAAAREGRLSPDDMRGSTFAISNLGMYGVEQFTALINPGESAILAVGTAVPTPVVVGDGIGIRSVMRLTLSADHRLLDGELAARFLAAVRARLERPAELDRRIEV